MVDNFIYECKKEIANRLMCSQDEVYIVWLSKTLHHVKGCFASDSRSGKGRYYEITYNGVNKEMYVDTYVKNHNEVIKIDLMRY